MGIYRKYDLTTEAIQNLDWEDLKLFYSIDKYKVTVFDGYEEFSHMYDYWVDAKAYARRIYAGTPEDFMEYCQISVIGLVFD